MNRLIPAAALAVFASFPASALEVTRSAHLAASPASVWSVIGAFCSISAWYPGIERCSLTEKDGKSVRTLDLKGGGRFVEALVAHDDKAMSYAYEILESPLPVTHYKGVITVAPDGDGSTMTWRSEFDAKGVGNEEASRTVAGSYDVGLKAVAAKVE